MPKEFPRSRRVEEQIQRVLGDAIRARARDPRLRGVILTDVRVSRDLSVARVYYSVLQPTIGAADPQPGLDAATGFLRSVLARELQVRHVPQLRFMPDEVARRGAELDRLIDEAVARDRPDDTLPADDDKDPS